MRELHRMLFGIFEFRDIGAANATLLNGINGITFIRVQ
jgi:hypothetical protein